MYCDLSQNREVLELLHLRLTLQNWLEGYLLPFCQQVARESAHPSIPGTGQGSGGSPDLANTKQSICCLNKVLYCLP